MKLKSLLVSGFKSFPEARLDFPQGITAVVGPNGVGKSNIVDAILWVLGEQSTKALRSERMEDVIFNGTESRKPLGMAEVSLVLSDVTSQELEAVAGVMESLPGNKELMVTRRLYRDGESEYSISKIPCRLKDIRGLFLEARAGAKGHTVIEQGNIDQLLSGSPQDRRTFIEETAGIGRFKKQKTEALNKLKTTQQNLTRVRDIIAEVEKQLRTLKRQAQQAEHYRKLKEESRALEIRILKHDYEGLRHQRTHVESELARLGLREAELMAEEARLTASYEEAKSALLRDGEHVGHMQEELRQLEHGIGQALTTMEVERNRADMFDQQRTQALEEQARLVAVSEQAATSIESLQDQVQRAEGDTAQVTGRLTELETEEQRQGEQRTALQTRTAESRQLLFDLAVERSQTEAQLANLDTKQRELGTRLQDVQDDQAHCGQEQANAESTLAEQTVLLEQVTRQLAADRETHETLSAETLELEERIREVDQQRVQEQTNRAAAESRLQALQAVLREELGYRQGQEGNDLSLRRVCQGVQEVFAERLKVPQEYEVAIEAALGEHIRAWVVHGVDDVLQALEVVTEQGWGRGTFVTAKPPVSSAFPESWSALEKAKGVLGRAVDLVAVPKDLQGVLQCLLGRVVLVDTLEDGLSAMKHVSQSDLGFLLLVTKTGEVIDPRGIVTGGSSGEASGLLQRRREVHALEQELSSMDQRIAGFDDQRRTVQERFESNKQQLQTLEVSLKESEMRQLVVEQERSALTNRLQDLEQRLNANQAELDSCQVELAQVREHEGLARTRLEEITQQHGEEEARLEESATQLQEMDEAIRVLYDRLTETRLTLTTYRERHERARADLDRLQEEDHSRRARIESLAEQIESLQVQAGQSQEERRRADATFQELDARKTTLQGELREVEERHTNDLQRTREHEQGLNENRKQCSSTRETRGESDVQLAEIRTRMQTIEETLTGTYGESMEVSEAETPQPDDSHDAGGEGPETWRERVQTIRTRMDRMGALNLAAIDEHRELEERYRFLHEQEEDLSESIRSLQEIIERLNRTTNRMFQQTFEAVQEKFGEVFSAFFAGGQAELVLVKPDPEEQEEEMEIGLEPGVDIIAQPPGKRLKNLTMLSGGEKALTVLALLFASFLTKPSPFCILDEVDAPLDEPNVVRFARFLPQLTRLSQFLVITHNKRTMEVADSLFGVTMEEPGVSKFVSVRIADFEKV